MSSKFTDLDLGEIDLTQLAGVAVGLHSALHNALIRLAERGDLSDLDWVKEQALGDLVTSLNASSEKVEMRGLEAATDVVARAIENAKKLASGRE